MSFSQLVTKILLNRTKPHLLVRVLHLLFTLESNTPTKKNKKPLLVTQIKYLVTSGGGQVKNKVWQRVTKIDYLHRN